MSLGRSQGGLPPDDVVQREDDIRADCERVVAEYHDASRCSMCQVALAPCSPFSVTEDEMKRAAELARRLGVRLHTHLAETLDEEKFCLEQRGVRPLAYMERAGWIGSDVWFAHGVHFDDAELDLLARTRTGVAHCPSSNLRLGSGIARVPDMLGRGVPVGLAGRLGRRRQRQQRRQQHAAGDPARLPGAPGRHRGGGDARAQRTAARHARLGCGARP
jgi:cytosine/adenosine deaminase-related metal-dependent hydrolase